MLIKEETKTFPLVPAGMYQAVCFDFWDIGMQEVEHNGKKVKRHKGYLAWELNKRIASDDESNGKRFWVKKKYTLSLDPRSTLAAHLSSWLGKTFTKEERAAGFDTESVIGANCFINVSHIDYNGKTYAMVSTVNPLPEGMPAIKAETQRGKPAWLDKTKTATETVADDGEEEIPF